LDRIRCVLDLQGAQGESRFRGIGRYSHNFAAAVARTAGEHHVWIALNGLFPETATALRCEFDSLVPQERIVTFHVPGPTAELNPGNSWRRCAAERIREHFLAGLNPDVVHVSSMVEGFVDDSVTSVGLQDPSFATAATFYDAIPMRFPDQYLALPGLSSYYLRKIQWLKRTDLLFAISESSRKEAIEALHIPEDRVVNISTGLEERFTRLAVSSAHAETLLKKYGLSRPFIMYSGAVDARKNIEGLIAALGLLPSNLRHGHQLLIAGKNDADARKRLEQAAGQHGLSGNALVFSGFVNDDDLLHLYNLCTLFVLPSFHEGFGLPALEAMACGAPVLASNVTSLPEVVGWQDALFDPSRPAEIASKITQAIEDRSFRDALREHGLEQAKKFTWERTAKIAWSALEELKASTSPYRDQLYFPVINSARPKLAYFSPLPPERSGISDYSAELLPELARYYEIDVVVEQERITDDWINANFPVRSASWFERHASNYDRILYQMGNSPFHVYMLDILRRHPGVVVLHDFYLSSLFRWMTAVGGQPQKLSHAVFDSHGYLGLLQESEFGEEWTVRNLPCSGPVIEAAAGVIVHSDFSRRLAEQWYGRDVASGWRVVPQLRSQLPADRNASRARLGIPPEDYLVCSFGLIDPTKLSDRVLCGWLQSQLAEDEHCRLVFVGENHGGEYGQQLLEHTRSSKGGSRIRITGYCPKETYLDYLAAADCAVQLRTDTRGETSRALLDCLGYGLPTIINSHGSFTDVPDGIAYKLHESFSDMQLSAALGHYYSDQEARNNLSESAREFIKLEHHPARIAEKYRDAIEEFASSESTALEQRLIASLTSMPSALAPTHADYVSTARAIAMNRRAGPRQLLLDVSDTAKNDLKTGIQRVACNISRELIEQPGEWRVEPIRLLNGQRLYARSFALSLVNSKLEMEEPHIEFRSGDVYLALDWCPDAVVEDRQFFSHLHALNIPVYFTIYDLLPMLQPDKFPDWAVGEFRRWLTALCEVAGGVVCISRSVADELLAWLDKEPPKRKQGLKIGYFHLGADIQDAKQPASGGQAIPPEAAAAVAAMKSRPSLLMVGTLEPRKGHVQALDAFEMLWQEGKQVNLVIIGHEGWHMEALVDRLTRHEQAGTKLFWLPSANDEVLSGAYQGASGLLAASQGEGFGLPLIEAARHGLPILARDIPVFREVAGEHACYFVAPTADHLKNAVRSWIEIHAQGRAPSSRGLKWFTWEESTRQLLDFVVGGNFYREWSSAGNTEQRPAGKTVGQ
jgi:glycosyltransferase involved in cell wall biosynthesis